jgi:hypothetical protein
MALVTFTNLVGHTASWDSPKSPANKKGLPFLGRQPLVVQQLTRGWREASRYRSKQSATDWAELAERLH